MKMQNRDFNKKKTLLSIIKHSKPLSHRHIQLNVIKLGPILMIDHFLPQFLLLHGSYYYLIFFKLVFYSSNSLFYSPASYKRKLIMESMKIIRTPKHIFV